MSDVDYIALAFEPHGNVTMRQLRRAALREREAKDVLAARLAEVEAKAVRDRIEIEALTDERDEARTWLAKRARSLRDVEAERDRLAQELEDALGHLRAVLDAWDPMAENYEMGPFFEAREFLARFPVKEGDGNG